MNPLKTATIEVLKKTLPNRVKNALFHVSFHIANNEFEKFSYEYSHAPNMVLGLEAMSARGFTPRTVIDVGAFEGNWSRMAKRLWPSSKIVMVEPNVQKREMLEKLARDMGAQLVPELLGAEDGKTVEFHVMESGSSVLEENSGVPRHTEKRTLRTLDSLLSTTVDGPALLKIDAQGYELEILRGTAKLLPKVEAVLLEVAIIEINRGAPLLHDVVAFMKSQGFVTYDILEIHRRPLDRALNQVDIVFIREDSKLIADKRHYA